MPNSVFLTCPSLQILSETEELVVKLEPLPRFYKRSTTTSKKFGDNIISVSYNNVVIFRTNDWFGAIWNPVSEFMIYNFYIFINSNQCIPTIESRTKKSLAKFWYYCFEWSYYFSQKLLIFDKRKRWY